MYRQRTIISALFLPQFHHWSCLNWNSHLLFSDSIAPNQTSLGCAPANLSLVFFSRCGWTPVTALSTGWHLKPIELTWISKQQLWKNSSSWSDNLERKKELLPHWKSVWFYWCSQISTQQYKLHSSNQFPLVKYCTRWHWVSYWAERMRYVENVNLSVSHVWFLHNF